MNDTTMWCQNASVTEPQREGMGGARVTVDCAIEMERVLILMPRSPSGSFLATSLPEGGSMPPRCAVIFFLRADMESAPTDTEKTRFQGVVYKNLPAVVTIFLAFEGGRGV